LDGATLRLGDLQGRPVWVNFFATWCPPCRAENPDIEATYREYQGAGSDLAIVALSLGEDAATVRDYVQKTGLTYTIGLDTSTLIAATYRVTGLPTHVFIDRTGVVRSIRVGGLQRDMMKAELAKIH
jgi:thiol-disulfide isomerase/thioredoxin